MTCCRRIFHLPASVLLLNAPVLLWILLLFMGEIMSYKWAAFQCLSSSSTKYNAIVVADPQLTDVHSYPFMRSSRVGAAFTAYYSDLYMKRSYHSLCTMLSPQLVIFLGDLFDGGRHVSPLQYQFELERWHAIFSGCAGAETVYVAGNHDIGIGQYMQPARVATYTQWFAPLNFEYVWKTPVRQLSIAIVCAPCLAESNGAAPDPYHEDTLQFVESAPRDRDVDILLTHIPLHRTTGCNQTLLQDVRRHHTAPVSSGSGLSYQNTLSPEVSGQLLQSLRPRLVLSGDDHDHCAVQHTYHRSETDVRTVVEFTVGTFSFLQGNAHPSVGLLSVREAGDGNGVEYRVCALPNQLTILLAYAVCFVATVLLYFLLPYCLVPTGSHQKHTIHRLQWQGLQRVLLLASLYMFLHVAGL